MFLETRSQTHPDECFLSNSESIQIDKDGGRFWVSKSTSPEGGAGCCCLTSPLGASVLWFDVWHLSLAAAFKGADPNSRNSFQVLQPPGGGPNLLLGFDEPTEQVVGKNKWLLTSLRHRKKVPCFGPCQQVPSLCKDHLLLVTSHGGRHERSPAPSSFIRALPSSESFILS